MQFDDDEGEIMELQVENADNSEFPSDGEDEENAAAEAASETTASSVSDDDEDCDEDSEEGEISDGVMKVSNMMIMKCHSMPDHLKTTMPH